MFNIIFCQNVHAAFYQLSQTSVSIRVGEDIKLSVLGDYESLHWQTEDKSIIGVSLNGKIRGKKAGKAIINAIVDGSKLQCDVTVLSYPLIDVVFKNMKQWSTCKYEKKKYKVSTIDFFTYRDTGEVGFAANYGVGYGHAYSRMFVVKKKKLVELKEYDEIKAKGGITDNKYLIWDNSAKKSKKYQNLSSLYVEYRKQKAS